MGRNIIIRGGLFLVGILVTFLVTLTLDVALKHRLSDRLVSTLHRMPLASSLVNPELIISEASNAYTNRDSVLYWFIRYPLANPHQYELRISIAVQAGSGNARAIEVDYIRAVASRVV